MIVCKEITFEEDLSWDDLVEQSSTATFFQTREWLSHWVKYWGKSSEVVIYAVFDNDELIGIAPFHITDKINILGVPDPSESGSLSDFGDIIAKTGKEKEVWEAVFRNIKRDPATMLRMTNIENIKIELNYIREESPSFEILKELGGKTEVMEVSPCIDLPASWEEFLSTLSHHDRHEIRRKIRKIEEEGIIKYCDEINNQNINEFYRLMVASNETKGNFLSPDMKDFFSEVITRLGAKKLLTLCFLKYNNESIAAILLLFQKNEMLLYNSGFDPKYSYLSPGLVLNAYAIREAIEKGMKRFDFLRGKEKYKYDLGGKERRLYRIRFD